MFGCCKAKPKEKNIKKVKKADYGSSQDFDIGSIEVDLTFKDGRKFIATVYGSFSQFYSSGYTPMNDDVVGPPLVKSALKTAQEMITYLVNKNTYVNDVKNPTVSMTGQVVMAQIDVNSERSHIEQHSVMVLVEKDVEIK